MQMRQKLLVRPGKMARLTPGDRGPEYYVDEKKESVERELAHLSSQMSELQYKLFADNSQSLLIILQGVDASGNQLNFRNRG
jgi:polyphosphate kinase 2 (PPK2 family)